MIGIRADANGVIASGHMMRCITIARALVEFDESVTFFMADEESNRLFCANTAEDHFDAVVLNSDYQDMEGELEKLKHEIKRREISVLLVDSYAVTYNYFDSLREECRLIYLDDLFKESYPVDAVINYSGYSKNMGYEDGYKLMSGHDNKPTRLYLGLKYAPLRKQYYDTIIDSDIERSFEGKEGLHILVSTGGADVCDMLSPLLEMAISVKWPVQTIWHIVIGGLTSGYDKVAEVAKNHDNVVIHRAVSNMAYLMKKCDLAVMSAGTMLTECAACGLPTVFYQVADNQKYNVKYWGSVDGMSFAGDVSANAPGKTAIIATIKNNIATYLENVESLALKSEKLKMITDGRGALEIAKVLVGEK